VLFSTVLARGEMLWFVEFWRELGKKMLKKWKFAKNLVQNAEFFYHLEISLP
jgi:hypothetical protein